MAQSILLDARTNNFLELVGNGKHYTVPPYQRDYSWGEEQWEDLWNDILAMRTDRADRHYMGALVVETTSDRTFKVIDGQQRLATLSIIALVIIDRLHQLAKDGIQSDENRERAEALRSIFIGAKDPASLTVTSKLTLNETDDGFYQDYLVSMRIPPNPRRMPKSNQLLWECFQWYQKQVKQLDATINHGKGLAELLNETVSRQLLFIFIAVNDELNAYTVFETLNARGIELSTTDLLKNYLFSRVKPKQDLKVLQRRWKTLIATVRQERFPQFLRYHFLCDTPKVRSVRLYKMVRERVKSIENVFDLIEALSRRAELFTALADSNHEFWIDLPDCKPFIRERVLYRDQQSVPLLFAAWEKLPNEFARILMLINAFTFRYTTVSNLNANDLEPLYHRAAKAVLEGKAGSAQQIFDLLREDYVEDKRFRQNFEVMQVSTSGLGKKLTKYILCRLESSESERDLDFETDSGTIEHIIPENPSEDWYEDITEEEWNKNVYRLGNLSLLERSTNSRVGNALLGEKLEAYRESRYKMTRDLAEMAPDKWNANQVDLRQQKMAKQAAHLWRSDFS